MVEDKKIEINFSKILYSKSIFEIYNIAKLIASDVHVGVNSYIYPKIYESSIHNLDLDNIIKNNPKYIKYRTLITKLIQNWLILTFIGSLKKNNLISYQTTKHLKLNNKTLKNIPIKKQADICYLCLVKVIEQSLLNAPDLFNDKWTQSSLQNGNAKFLLIEKILEQLVGIEKSQISDKNQTPISSSLIKLLSSFLKINNKNDDNKYDYCKGKYKRTNRFLVNKLSASHIAINDSAEIYISSNENELKELITSSIENSEFNFISLIPLNKKSYKYYLKIYPLMEPTVTNPFKKPEILEKRRSPTRKFNFIISKPEKWLNFLKSKLTPTERSYTKIKIISE